MNSQAFGVAQGHSDRGHVRCDELAFARALLPAPLGRCPRLRGRRVMESCFMKPSLRRARDVTPPQLLGEEKLLTRRSCRGIPASPCCSFFSYQSASILACTASLAAHPGRPPELGRNHWRRGRARPLPIEAKAASPGLRGSASGRWQPSPACRPDCPGHHPQAGLQEAAVESPGDLLVGIATQQVGAGVPQPSHYHLALSRMVWLSAPVLQNSRSFLKAAIFFSARAVSSGFCPWARRRPSAPARTSPDCPCASAACPDTSWCRRSRPVGSLILSCPTPAPCWNM